jgi:hypothetical protein
MIRYDKSGNPIPLQPLPSLKLNEFQIYSYVNPIAFIPSTGIISYASTISFNSSNLTVKRNYNNNAFGYLGINTLTPTYALDIAIGDARKPTGTTWITASDSRVKETILPADFQVAVEKISSLRLVSYIWDEDYSKEHRLTNQRQLGFISQEVQEVFPESVTHSEERGFTDFKSLDVDQLYKAKYIVTQYLLERVLFLEMRISKLMKS